MEIKSSLLNSKEMELVKDSLIMASEIDHEEDFRVNTLEYINDSADNNEDEFFYDMLEFTRFLKPDKETTAYTTPEHLIFMNCPGIFEKKVRYWDFIYCHECLHQLWDTFGVAEKIKNEGIKCDYYILNIASDCVINDYLSYYRNKIHPDGLITPEYLKKNYDVDYNRKKDTQYTLYLKLLEKANELKKDKTCQDQCGDDSQSGSGKPGQSGEKSQSWPSDQPGEAGNSVKDNQSSHPSQSSGQGKEQSQNKSDSDQAEDAAKEAQDAADKAKETAGNDKDKKEAADKAQEEANKAKEEADKAKEAEENGNKKEAKEHANKAKEHADNAKDAAKEAGVEEKNFKHDSNSKGQSDESKEQSDSAQAEDAVKEAQDAADKAKKAAGNDKDKKEAADKAQEEADKAQEEADKAKEAEENGNKKEAKEHADKAKEHADNAKDAAKEAGVEEKDLKNGEKQNDSNDKGQGHGSEAREESDIDLDKIKKEAEEIINKYKEKLSGDLGQFINQCKSASKLKESGLMTGAQKGVSLWNQKLQQYTSAYVKNKVFKKQREFKRTYQKVKRGSGFVEYGQPIQRGKKIKDDKLLINVAFYIDRSGSMAGCIDDVFQASYIIANSLQKQFGKEKVVDKVSFKMFAFDDKMEEVNWGKKVNARGGTMDFDKILEFIKDKTNDYLINIIITDAGFTVNEQKIENFLKDINGCVVFVSNTPSNVKDIANKQQNKTKLFYIQADSRFTID